MTENELKKKLAVLKTVRVPKGYWDSYWPRLQMKLERAEGRAGERAKNFSETSIFRVAVPVFAAFVIGMTGYQIGLRQASESHSFAHSPIQLTSANTETQAQRVFREMLSLFPNRVNWVSFVNGQVDFSISSAAYPQSKTLVPLILTLPRPKDSFEARFLVRPGQSVSAQGEWEKHQTVLIQLQLSTDGTQAKVSCRMNGGGSIEGRVSVAKEGTQPLGTFRVGDRLIQVQLTRSAPKKESANGL